ncbi:L-cystine transporter [Thermaerobacter subterraneus]|uniref:L-cystine uptake protein TcyP n=1 Tax=Thermaerobacter subterraneus DSM 13965 TaxID=867903 RepID=K6PRF3_9FIRM|nr:cation:dicarboxylase symporter family transporter [Thermaerobacter subterraneus]EKP95492.1 putative Na+/dicarboxylate symporter [Thermaerobacter subterraneus DSM 13965]
MAWLPVALNVAGLFVLIAVLYWMKGRGFSFSSRVFAGLGLGVIYGLILHTAYQAQPGVIPASVEWFNLVGTGYVKLLQMVTIPLVFVAIVSAFTRMELADNTGRLALTVVAILVATTAIAAVLGIGSVGLFGLDASQFHQGQAEAQRIQQLEQTFGELQQMSAPERLLELLPANPFLDFTGQRRASTIAVVIFAAFVGSAYLGLRHRDPQAAETFAGIVRALEGVVMGMVRQVIRLTPYGILAIMTRVAATSDYGAIWQLGKLVVASYAALVAMFLLHLLFLGAAGLSPAAYVRKALPVLTFAFSSRSSAATLPLNVRTQVEELGVPQGIANLAGSLGLSIGQNGCAGVYPAMLAVMAAPLAGIDPWTPGFLLSVVGVVAISSFGVAGVGGGATFASLLVLSMLNLPVGLAGLLISVEPLIDMGRTALNVSGAMTAGILTSRLAGRLDVDVYRGRRVPGPGTGTGAEAGVRVGA